MILRGELGAGKTTLAKGWIKALNGAATDEVTSPTFTLVQEYECCKGRIYHLDLYRLETERELATLGLEEMMAEAGSLVLIEWGDKFPALLQKSDAEFTELVCRALLEEYLGDPSFTSSLPLRDGRHLQQSGRLPFM